MSVERPCPSPEDVARRFVEAFNVHDADRFEALLDPEVVLHTARGPKQGRVEARGWLGGPGENLTSTVEIERWEADGERVLASGKRSWRWAEGGELAEEHPYAAIWRIRTGLILEWRAYDELEAARTDYEAADG